MTFVVARIFSEWKKVDENTNSVLLCNFILPSQVERDVIHDVRRGRSGAICLDTCH